MVLPWRPSSRSLTDVHGELSREPQDLPRERDLSEDEFLKCWCIVNQGEKAFDSLAEKST
jgi:hypothetical protein